MPGSRTLIIPLLQVRAQEHDAAVELGEELQRDHLRAVLGHARSYRPTGFGSSCKQGIQRGQPRALPQQRLVLQTYRFGQQLKFIEGIQRGQLCAVPQ